MVRSRNREEYPIATQRVSKARYFVACLSCFAWRSRLPPHRAQNAAALIEKGGRFDEQLKEKEALECYLPANRLEPDNVDLLVRIARQYRHLMSDTTSKMEKLRLGNISLRVCSARRSPRSK